MHTCAAKAPLKNYSIETLKRSTAELLAKLLVECKCQFIRVKQEQASEKL